MADPGKKKAPGRAGTLLEGKKWLRKGQCYWVKVSCPKVNAVGFIGPFRASGDGQALKGGVSWNL